MTVISIILGILKAIPILDGWFQSFSAAYVQSRIASLTKENSDAIRKAFQEHDQRDAEKAIGSPNPGEASGQDGAEIVDAPPPNIVS